MGLLQIVVEKGANLQTNTPVLSSSEKRDGEWYWGFETGRGVIRARKVVFAMNGYTGGVLPEYRDVILPRRACCSYISTPASRSSQTSGAKPKGVAIGKESSFYIGPPASGFDYLIQRPDGSIVVGGGSSLYRSIEGATVGVWDDSTLISQLGNYFEGYLRRWFKQGAEGEKLEMVWSGSESSYLLLCLFLIGMNWLG